MRRPAVGAFVLAAALHGCTQIAVPTRAVQSLQPLVAHQTNRAPSPEVALGFRLFFDTKLSGNGRLSCGNCHQAGKGFSDGEPVAVGINGQKGTRNTPTIYTAAAAKSLFWDGRAATLEAQALMPIENPIEMGAKLPDVIARLNKDALYGPLFQTVYGGPATTKRLASALAAFERALTANRSPFDRFIAGDQTALTEPQQRGWQVFQDRGRCIECHTLPDFTDHQFHNLGVGTDRPNVDIGRKTVTGSDDDWAGFKTPTLRNISKTGPYMHDGSITSLEEVIKLYDRGGVENPHLDAKIKPIHLMRDEREDLLAFMDALTSPDNLKDLAPPSTRP